MSKQTGSATVIIGGQWGDEGKGKFVDYLAHDHDLVVRYQGGANAGHTIRAEGQEFIFHLIPSGILLDGKDCLLGNGLVVDPLSLADEVENLKQRGVSIEGRLFVSSGAQLILPYHRVTDRVQEEAKKGKRIGTTGRGIGPAYTDKAARTGLRAEVFLWDDDRFKRTIIERTIEQNRRLDALYDGDPVSPNESAEKLLAVKPLIAALVVDSQRLLWEALESGRRVLLEGAQGTLLDLDHGTYPFVTSSSPSVGGAICGSGVPPKWFEETVGIFKAYCTRVGNGPFPSELEGEIGEKLRSDGAEFGATTGRPRRCGWFDLVAARYATRLNGFSRLAITKFDVLSGRDTISVCTAYRVGDELLTDFPHDVQMLERAEPVLEELPGWQANVSDARSLAELPPEAIAYLRYLEGKLAVPIGWVSVGPDREQTIIVEKGAVETA